MPPLRQPVYSSQTNEQSNTLKDSTMEPINQKVSQSTFHGAGAGTNRTTVPSQAAHPLMEPSHHSMMQEGLPKIDSIEIQEQNQMTTMQQ